MSVLNGKKTSSPKPVPGASFENAFNQVGQKQFTECDFLLMDIMPDSGIIKHSVRGCLR